MESLRDYLHLLVPCICIRTDTGRQMRLVGIDDHDENWHVDDKCVRFEGAEWKWSAVETYIKPSLRPMSDMTEKERIQAEKIGDFLVPGEMPASYKQQVKARHEAEKTRYYIKQKLDVFDLIGKGLAVSSIK